MTVVSPEDYLTGFSAHSLSPITFTSVQMALIPQVHFIYYLLIDFIALHILEKRSGVAQYVIYVQKVVPCFEGLRYIHGTFGNFRALAEVPGCPRGSSIVLYMSKQYISILYNPRSGSCDVREFAAKVGRQLTTLPQSSS